MCTVSAFTKETIKNSSRQIALLKLNTWNLSHFAKLSLFLVYNKGILHEKLLEERRHYCIRISRVFDCDSSKIRCAKINRWYCNRSNVLRIFVPVSR